MKKQIHYFIIAVIAGSLLNMSAALATIIPITVSNSTFTPNNVTVSVGDTIRWTWVSGFHTTTSTTIPGCAVAWDAQMNSSDDTLRYVIPCAGTYNYQCSPHLFTGVITAVATGVNDADKTPHNFVIYPTEFNKDIRVDFAVNETGMVKLELFDIIGRQVALVLNEKKIPGFYSIKFELDSRLKTGIYVLQFTDGFQSVQTSRLLVR